jgi:hypothetical protein
MGNNVRPLVPATLKYAERLAREDYDQEVAFRIKRACYKWMPYVALEELVPIDEEPTAERGSRSEVPTRAPRRSLEIASGC